ncbi:MAG: GNAT family N-acetyltransferase [Thermoplasmatota archaeon]|nr:GNAT family N-acetyltransferase [Candidatus Thermoplasmatota archaeon]MBU1914220.1 GNAT family N-acetyltransferase [Candidatus Thermoplasmatota archaeon]
MDEEPTREGPLFRQFRADDMDACSRLAWDAWVAGSDKSDEFADPRVMEGYVRTFVVRSNWTEVAHDSHGVTGLLFGRIGSLKGKAGSRSLSSKLGMIPQFLFGTHGQHVSPVLLWHFFMTEFKVLVNVPRSDAEVNLIIVDPKYQGKGLGKKLIERFVGAARDARCRLVTLYTDDQASNWRFYEVIGFRKVATFHDGLTSYFVERDAKGIVYVLDVK